MDRFIEPLLDAETFLTAHLKSNMDRFIEKYCNMLPCEEEI